MHDDTPERWLPVPGYESAYEVSDQGRVRNSKTGRVLRPNKRGPYLQVRLGRKTHRVHRLVMTAFIGPRPPGLETRHLDGNSVNNAATNLRYGTHAENMQDAVRHGSLAGWEGKRPGKRPGKGSLREGPPPPFCQAGHEMTGGNVRLRHVDGRVDRICRACQAIYMKRFRERRRQPEEAA